MSGGHFDYKQYELGYMADEIEQLIRTNNENLGDSQFSYVRNYSDETLKEFQKGSDIIREALVYAHRIDWLVSGDDGENSFHKRLKEELNNLKIIK